LETFFKLSHPDKQVELFGPADSHLRFLRQELCVRITAREDGLRIVGQKGPITRALGVIDKMQAHLARHGLLTATDVQAIVKTSQLPTDIEQGKGLIVYSRGREVKASTRGQMHYIETMLDNDVTFCVGPAGTGKTYLAVAVAVSMLKKKLIRRIVLARPAVEAGEKLGYLPGDLQAKVNPYLRPLFDALEDMMDFAQMRKFMDLDIIEIIPLAFMRGRTLNESVIICDEAQNTSGKQMLMVLTRLGHGSKMIITGDVTQTDLEANQESGIVEAIKRLKDIDGIGVVELARTDIVRHRLVQSIVDAYQARRGAAEYESPKRTALSPAAREKVPAEGRYLD
jgi:phosphate starvation-inducible PhoH-like protein